MQIFSHYISICIPAYKAAKYISETLESVCKQSYTNWEIIVYEDGTYDGTEQIVHNLAQAVKQKVSYLHNKKNMGAPAARNRAANIAEGNWLIFLDSDDVWLPNHLESLVITSIQYSGCDLVHSGTNVFDSETKEVTFKQEIDDKAIQEVPISIFDRRYSVQLSSAMVSKKFMDETGGFLETLRYTDDLEIVFKSAKAGIKYAYTQQNTSYYRKHAEGITNNHLNIILGIAQVYDIYNNWQQIPQSIRNHYGARSWFAVAKISRKTNRKLAKTAITKAMMYKFSFKHLAYWILIHGF